MSTKVKKVLNKLRDCHYNGKKYHRRGKEAAGKNEVAISEAGSRAERTCDEYMGMHEERCSESPMMRTAGWCRISGYGEKKRGISVLRLAKAVRETMGT